MPRRLNDLRPLQRAIWMIVAAAAPGWMRSNEVAELLPDEFDEVNSEVLVNLMYVMAKRRRMLVTKPSGWSRALEYTVSDECIIPAGLTMADAKTVALLTNTTTFAIRGLTNEYNPVTMVSVGGKSELT